jgi:hypothetical protein
MYHLHHYTKHRFSPDIVLHIQTSKEPDSNLLYLNLINSLSAQPDTYECRQLDLDFLVGGN